MCVLLSFDSFDATDPVSLADPTLYTQTDYCIADTTQTFFMNYSFTQVSTTTIVGDERENDIKVNVMLDR